MQVELPPELLREVRDLVVLGEFPDEGAAVIALVREGLGYRYRRSPSPVTPREDREWPRAPGLPPDVNWVPGDRED
jgi:Arc/MetJ-type ribon-helix-helix transcriptional regulator